MKQFVQLNELNKSHEHYYRYSYSVAFTTKKSHPDIVNDLSRTTQSYSSCSSRSGK